VRRKLGFAGLETTVIDYTLSRADMDSPAAGEGTKRRVSPLRSGEVTDATHVAFFDLEKDPAIFEGDAEQDYQYEVYRQMRAAVYLDDPLADIHARWDEATATGRTWRGYHPQTNLVWLAFVIQKILEQVQWPSEDVEDRDEGVSVAQWQRSRELAQALQRVRTSLDPATLVDSGLHAAGDLVTLALNEGWLDVEDVVGSTGSDGSRTEKGLKASSKSKGRSKKQPMHVR